MPTVTASTVTASSNFLIPNGTFIAELVGFVIIVIVLGRTLVPRINQALAERQEMIRRSYSDAEEAKARLDAAEAEYRELIASARADAARQREEAREEGAQILADLRAQAQVESERIRQAAQQQLEAERSRTVEALRAEVGTLAVELAGRVVGEALTDDARQRRVVERFLSDVESRAGEAAGSAAAGEQVRGCCREPVETRSRRRGPSSNTSFPVTRRPAPMRPRSAKSCSVSWPSSMRRWACVARCPTRRWTATARLPWSRLCSARTCPTSRFAS